MTNNKSLSLSLSSDLESLITSLGVPDADIDHG